MSLTRLARMVAVSTVALMSLAACSAISPITTQFQYSASDGLPVDLGVVQGHNLLLVTEGAGQPAILLGSFTNAGDQDVRVTISLSADEAQQVWVPAGGLKLLIPEEEITRVSGIATAAPGLVAPVAFTTDSVGTITLQVPVMDGTLPEYRDLIDAIPSPEPSPTPSPSPEPSASPSPEPSVSPEPAQ